MSLSGTDRAKLYVDDVLEGWVPACDEVQQACRRQWRDLQNPDFEYHFDEDAANKVVRFIEKLPHVKGKGFVGKDIVLENWQCFILTTVFGWLDDNGNRRFRTAYIEVPRKNAKSTLSSGVGLYMLLADGEPGAEIYSAATGRDQAKIIYNDAKAMVNKKPSLRSAFGVSVLGGETAAGTIKHIKSNSIFKPLSRDTKGNLDGLNIHCGLIDELHAHKTRDMWDVLETGVGARQQPLIWAITTAGSNRAGICYEQRSYSKKVLAGDVEDETYFGIIYTVDKGDDWNDELTWMKANPNWGVSVNVEDIRRLAVKAKEMPSAQNNFLTKRLNVWVNAAVAWMNMFKWEECSKEFGWERFKGFKVYISLDLSSRLDIAAVNYTWKDGDILYGKGRFYLPKETVETGRNSQYSGWVRSGDLIETPGSKTDFEAIKNQLLEDRELYEIKGIAYDTYQAQMLANELEKKDFPMIEFPQNISTMSEPMKEWEAKVVSKEYVFDGNPVMTWLVSNVVVDPDKKDNIFPYKETRENKIDGAVAQIMGVAQAMGDDDNQSVIFL